MIFALFGSFMKFLLVSQINIVFVATISVTQWVIICAFTIGSCLENLAFNGPL